MKYYKPTYISIGGQNYPCQLGYNIEDVPINKPIWAVAYNINDDTEHHRLLCKPIQGEIILNTPYEDNAYFIPYKKNGTGFCKSKRVDFNSRLYANSYEEAAELYNELVQKHIDKLLGLVQDAKNDMI